jgi:hypothetical protein
MNNEFLRRVISQVGELAEAVFESVKSKKRESTDKNENQDVDDLNDDRYDRKREESSDKLSLEYDKERKRISDKWKRY